MKFSEVSIEICNFKPYGFRLINGSTSPLDVPSYAFGLPVASLMLATAQFVHSESIFPIPENWGCKKTCFFTALF